MKFMKIMGIAALMTSMATGVMAQEKTSSSLPSRSHP